MKIAVLLITMISMAPAALAQREMTSGNYWVLMCQEPPGSLGESMCMSYLRDSVRAHAAFMRGGKRRPYFCIPPQTPEMQIKAAVVTFLAENPQYRNEDFSEIVTVALSRSFPCLW